jgi:hypothetical protein
MDVVESYRSNCTVPNPDAKQTHRHALVRTPKAERVSYFSPVTEQFDWGFFTIILLQESENFKARLNNDNCSRITREVLIVK